VKREEAALEGESLGDGLATGGSLPGVSTLASGLDGGPASTGEGGWVGDGSGREAGPVGEGPWFVDGSEPAGPGVEVEGGSGGDDPDGGEWEFAGVSLPSLALGAGMTPLGASVPVGSGPTHWALQLSPEQAAPSKVTRPSGAATVRMRRSVRKGVGMRIW